MSVNIIKDGNLPKINKTCEICGCEFEFDFRDVDKDIIYDLNCKSIYTIDCPGCRVAIRLNSTDKRDLKLNLCE